MTRSPQHILITGATGGIGWALAKIYAKQGIKLSLLGRKVSELEALAAQCKELGAEVSIYSIDVTALDKLKDLLQSIDSSNPVDLVIVSAGVSTYLTTDYDQESWDDTKNTLDVNVMGAFATASPFITNMRQRKKGQIAFVSSLAAYYGMPINPSYSASKAAIKAYAEALRGLLYKDNIKVSVICPGFIKSNMSDKFPGKKPFLMSAEKAARIIKKGLERNQGHIAFPFLLSIGMKFLTILPGTISDFILLNLGYGAISNSSVEKK